MRATIDQQTFSEIISRAQSVMERKSTRPILENVLITVQGEVLTLSATDLRISLTQTAKCTTQVDGSISLAGRKLHEIVREMSPGEITLELKENEWVNITGGKSTFHLPGTPAEEFPTIPQIPDNFISLDAAFFDQMVGKTLFAASSDETRIYLCGVFVKEWKDESGAPFVKMVATDGHRLSLVDRGVPAPLGLFEEGVIIPKKGVSELRGLISSVEGNFDLACQDGRIYARVGDSLLSVTLIEASFPNYNQVVPEMTGVGINVPSEEFRKALRRVSILSDQETRSVVLEVEGSTMKLSSDNPTQGDARETLDVDYGGDIVKAAFNSTYIMEILKVMEDDSVRLELKDSLSPALFVGTDKEADFVSVVMPMRID